MRFLPGLVLGLAAAVSHAGVPEDRPPAPATTPETEEPWVSSAGSGLLSLPDTSTLARKHLNLDFAFDNQDRDPIRLDVADYSIAWNYGVRPGLETYGHLVVSRAVAISDRTTVFGPPMDIVIGEGTLVPRRPYYLLYAPLPYVNRLGSSQFSRFVPGDAILGGKLRFLAQKSRRPALAATLELKLPTTHELSSLQSGAGTGGFDQTARLTAEWRRGRQSFLASTALTHVGEGAFGDQLIVFERGGGVRRAESPFRLASRLQLGLGFRHVVKPSVALVAEVNKSIAVGGHTSAYEAAGPLDVNAGAQVRWHRLHVTLGVRYHANSVESFKTEPSPFAGMADLTSVPKQELALYLDSIGAGAAIPTLRDRAQIAAALPADAPPLPTGGRILPPFYTVRSHDRIASLLVVGWSFGKPRREIAGSGSSSSP